MIKEYKIEIKHPRFNDEFFGFKKIEQYFLDILKIIKKILSKSENYKINTIDDIYSIDKKIRILTSEYIKNK